MQMYLCANIRTISYFKNNEKTFFVLLVFFTTFVLRKINIYGVNLK
jgi:hypothetical protein